MFRSRKPNSWWVTPIVRFLVAILHVLELSNWQRGGGKKAGAAPKPHRLPEDREVKVKSAGELKSKRQQQAEHLRKRRAERKRRSVTSQ